MLVSGPATLSVAPSPSRSIAAVEDEELLEAGPPGAVFDSDERPLGRWAGDPRRGLLRDELARRTTPRLAAMYWQAIRAMDDSVNEERIPVAAHLLRELQKVLPKHLPDAPQVKGRLTLGDLFRWLEGEWPRVRQTSACFGEDNRWSGAIDGTLAAFLRDLEAWITRYRNENPRWKSVQGDVLGRLDPALNAVPEPTRTAAVDLWLDLNDFFNGAAHHASVAEATFASRVQEFEEFLGDRLIPRTFAKRGRIAELVREAEDSADG